MNLAISHVTHTDLTLISFTDTALELFQTIYPVVQMRTLRVTHHYCAPSPPNPGQSCLLNLSWIPEFFQPTASPALTSSPACLPGLCECLPAASLPAVAPVSPSYAQQPENPIQNKNLPVLVPWKPIDGFMPPIRLNPNPL